MRTIKLLFAAALTLCTFSPAYADGTATVKPPEKPATAASAAPAGCKFVSVSRPDINPAKNEIYITFEGYGSDTAAVGACNPPAARQSGASNVFGVVPDPIAGARVSVRTKNGIGIVGLPTTFANGVVHQVACGHEGRKITFKLYKMDWSGGLPDRLNLQDQTKEIAAQASYYEDSCYQSAPPQMKAQLDAPHH